LEHVTDVTQCRGSSNTYTLGQWSLKRARRSPKNNLSVTCSNMQFLTYKINV